MQQIFHIFYDLFLTFDGFKLKNNESLIKVEVVAETPQHPPQQPPPTRDRKIFQRSTRLQAVIVDKNLTEIN